MDKTKYKFGQELPVKMVMSANVDKCSKKCYT